MVLEQNANLIYNLACCKLYNKYQDVIINHDGKTEENLLVQRIFEVKGLMDNRSALNHQTIEFQLDL